MKARPAYKEISALVITIITVCGCFIVFYLICYVLGFWKLDPWLLAGFSIAFGGRRLIFGSPSMIAFIENKANILYSSILIFFQVFAFLSFGIIFLVTTLLAQFNQFKINPLMDVSLALLVPALIVIYLLIVNKKKKQVHENNL